MDNKILKSLKVLYVEDDLKTLKIISQILENYFLEIFTAQDAFVAYELYKKEKIDIIITDLEMPEMSGITFISKIRNEDFHIPIVVFTAYTDTEHLLPCANYNIQGYIQKPVSPLKLEKVFKNLIAYINEPKTKKIVLNEKIVYDAHSCKIIKQNEEIYLSKKEKLFLDLLVNNKNSLVSYEKIEYILWENEGESMSNMALRTLVKVLRHKIDKELIQNISGMGYLLKI